MWNHTRFARLTGIRYPIVQGPFGGGLSSVALTSAVSRAGGLGSFGGQPYTAAELVATGIEIRRATDRPFNLNLWVGDRDESLGSFGAADWARLVDLFTPYFHELGLPLPERPTELGPRFEDQVEAIFAIRPAVFSFVYGIPGSGILERCRALGIVTLGAATTVEEAVVLEEAGVDAVVATGLEAGGHRVSFLRSAEESLTGLVALVPQVADRVRIPVVAAGGIADARGVRAALALGADAVQIGTAFLATEESNANALHRERLLSPSARETTLTRVFTGRLARGLRNRLTEELRGHEHLFAPYPLQGLLMRALRGYPATEGANGELQAHWAGQSAALVHHRRAEELLASLVRGMDTGFGQRDNA